MVLQLERGVNIDITPFLGNMVPIGIGGIIAIEEVLDAQMEFGGYMCQIEPTTNINMPHGITSCWCLAILGTATGITGCHSYTTLSLNVLKQDSKIAPIR